MTDFAAELAALDAFSDFSDDERRTIASLTRERRVSAGMRLLEQGSSNSSLFFLRSGEAAVRAARGGVVEMVARLSSPAVVGEISFLTGRPCSAHIDMLTDAVLAELPLEALQADHACRD